MIPRRIKLKGFMSFRDETELSFTDSSLWVLTGANAAGKSAIFDAIAFALYGVRRTNANDIGLSNTSQQKELINHQASNLEVEFEFGIGEKIFCVKRTLPKRGRASFQVCKCQSRDGCEGDPTTDFIPIEKTEYEEGFDAWVKENIGLDAKAFSAAVLLGQGKTDALLCHKPQARHNILSQIIDISAYERLHQRAKEHHDEHRHAAASYKQELDRVPAVADEHLAQIRAKLSDANDTLIEVQAELEKLAARKTLATRWVKLVEEEAEYGKLVLKDEGLLASGEEIERNAERFKELQSKLPHIERLLGARERLASAITELEVKTKEAARWEAETRLLEEEADRARAAFDQAKKEHDGLRARLDDVRRELLRLSSQIRDLDEADKLRSDLLRYDGELARYAADLDQQTTSLERESVELEELKNALLALNDYADARTQWRVTEKQVAETLLKQRQSEAGTALLMKEEHRLQEQASAVAADLDDAKRAATEAKTTLKHIRARLARLDQVDGQPTCDYCGLELTAAHLAAERERIQVELQTAEASERATAQHVKDETEQERTSTLRLKECREKTGQAKEQERQLTATLSEARKDQTRAVTTGRHAIARLPQTFSTRIAADQHADIAECFATAYPSTQELSLLDRQAARLIDVRKQLADLNAATKARDRIAAQREPAQYRLRELEDRYPADEAASLRRAEQAASQSQIDLDARLPVSEELVSSQDKEHMCIKTLASEMRTKWRDAIGKAKAEEGKREEAARTVAEREAELLRAGQTDVVALNVTVYETWRAEADALNNAPVLHEELLQAQREVDEHQRRLEKLRKEIDQIPLDARCAPDTLEGYEKELRDKQSAVEEVRRTTETEKTSLERQRAQRLQFEADYLEASEKEHLYKELSRLLGREHLQRKLLHDSEVSIVENANEVLERISNRTLRLQLVPEAGAKSDDGKPGKRAASKVSVGKDSAGTALELYFVHSETGGVPTPVELLSGGQRFRVAVSLALGIGRHAGQGRGRIESVIIDEGFGSLDKEGRREMLEELHGLKDELKRIILVSHHEEIADTFKSRYKVELTDGSSRVSLVDQ